MNCGLQPYAVFRSRISREKNKNKNKIMRWCNDLERLNILIFLFLFSFTNPEPKHNFKIFEELKIFQYFKGRKVINPIIDSEENWLGTTRDHRRVFHCNELIWCDLFKSLTSVPLLYWSEFQIWIIFLKFWKIIHPISL